MRTAHERNSPFMLQSDNGELAALSMPAAGQYALRLMLVRRGARGGGARGRR